MRILRSANYRRMPWKNGKGETVEIAVFPPDASVENFDWRISMATVAEDGAFSAFDGIDRTLIVLTGEGITLSVAGMTTVELSQVSAPYSFPGDSEASARLAGGAVTDLNVMTRRHKNTHRVERLNFEHELVVRCNHLLDLIFLFILQPIECNGQKLAPCDAICLNYGQTVVLNCLRPASVLKMEISQS